MRHDNIVKCSVKRSTNRDEAVAFGTLRLSVDHQLHVINLAERLKDAPQHVFCDVEVEGAHVEAHGSVGSLGEGAHGGHVAASHSVLLRLRGLDNDGHAAKLLARQCNRLQHPKENV